MHDAAGFARRSARAARDRGRGASSACRDGVVVLVRDDLRAVALPDPLLDRGRGRRDEREPARHRLEQRRRRRVRVGERDGDVGRGDQRGQLRQRHVANATTACRPSRSTSCSISPRSGPPPEPRARAAREARRAGRGRTRGRARRGACRAGSCAARGRRRRPRASRGARGTGPAAPGRSPRGRRARARSGRARPERRARPPPARAPASSRRRDPRRRSPRARRSCPRAPGRPSTSASVPHGLTTSGCVPCARGPVAVRQEVVRVDDVGTHLPRELRRGRGRTGSAGPRARAAAGRDRGTGGRRGRRALPRAC